MEILVIILFVLCIISFFVGRKFASKPIDDKNEEIKQKNEELHQQELKLESRIINLDADIKWKEQQLGAADEKIQLIQKQYEEKLKVIENTKQLADEELKQRKKVLENEFENYKSEQTIIKGQIENKIWQLQSDLESLKSTKAAAIEAARKEQEIQENKEFYTLQIPREEKRDIEILEDTKMRISKPRAIAMVIWTAYYQQIAKTKFPKILGKQDVCGIYKITNLITGECYIGQSKDVRKRWYEHMKAAIGIDTPVGNKLYAAMQAQGIDNFTFELLEECQPQDLDKKEKYFIELYHSDSLGYNGNAGKGTR